MLLGKTMTMLLILIARSMPRGIVFDIILFVVCASKLSVGVWRVCFKVVCLYMQVRLLACACACACVESAHVRACLMIDSIADFRTAGVRKKLFLVRSTAELQLSLVQT